ncbi:hypothetical protein N657DRAFT_684862 [Parathielavia appendiculata]|uniref:Uncharacterized protein n=1 Tax=Parathielavia appendiculata TaxID=2587402 RepID=A0AAN6YZY9_9PEZI|nr:hypothetical protein N657DRAFT_684862 [Parathielavia appendiculata]
MASKKADWQALGLKVRFRPVASEVGFDPYDKGDALPIVGLSLRQKMWDRCEEYVEDAFDY